jgi:L-gulonolactone oxidase
MSDLDQMLDDIADSARPAEAAQALEAIRSIWHEDRDEFARVIGARCEAAGGPPALRTRARPRRVNAGKREIWKNHYGNLVVQPIEIARPSTEADVQAIVDDARQKGLKVRVAGGGYSFSDLVATTGVLVELEGLDALDVLGAGVPGNATYVRVGAGNTIATLNAWLASNGLALENMPAFDGQKIVGAICTGVHGSGAKLGPLADQVVSLELVAGDGNRYRIEPSAGFSTTPPPAGVIACNDDDTFYSTVVGLGAMGIVTSVTLHVRPAYRLTETRKRVRWSTLKQRLTTSALVPHNYEVLINPYATGGDHWCLETTRDVTTNTQDPAWPKVRHWLAGLAEGSHVAADVLVWFLDKFPQLTPFGLDRALSLLEWDSNGLGGDSTEILLLGPTNDLSAISAEAAVPLDEAVAAIDAMLALAKQAAAVGDIYQTAPVGIRFVAASPHYLAPQYADPTSTTKVFCMIEMPLLEGTRGAFEILERFEMRMRDFGGRSHWGELHHEHDARARLSPLFPKIAEFRAVRAKLDPDGVFQNAFTDRCNL